jgi:hypothetical protein
MTGSQYEREVIGLVRDHYGRASVVVLCGSIARGEEMPSSDVDVIVVGPFAAPRRKVYQSKGRDVEIAVHTLETLELFIGSDVRSRRPLHLQMCAEGRLLVDREGHGALLQQRAQHLLREGPLPLGESERANMRSALLALLDDLRDAEDETVQLWVAIELLYRLADALLLVSGHWLGRGHWMARELSRLDPPTQVMLLAAAREVALPGTRPRLRLAAERLARDLGSGSLDAALPWPH